MQQTEWYSCADSTGFVL